jgi:hypothetical protein
MQQGLTVDEDVNFKAQSRPKPASAPPLRQGRVPRISRMMALAIRLDGLIREKAVTDYADIARLGHVTRARITQIMNFLHLAPDIQEAILFLPEVTEGRDPIREHDVRRIAAVIDWKKQRKMWRETCAQAGAS